jgi:hypothetical protein
MAAAARLADAALRGGLPAAARPAPRALAAAPALRRAAGVDAPRRETMTAERRRGARLVCASSLATQAKEAPPPAPGQARALPPSAPRRRPEPVLHPPP